MKIAGLVTGGTSIFGGALWLGLADLSYGIYGLNVGPIVGSTLMLVGGLTTTSACLIRAHNLTKKTSSNSVHSVPLYHQDFHLKNRTSLSAGVNMLKENTRHDPTLGLGLSYNF